MGAARDGSPMVSVKLSDKRAALRDLGHYFGLFKTDVRFAGVLAPISPGVLTSSELGL